MNEWKNWENILHDEPVQIKKQEKAATSDCKPINFDTVAKTGAFASSRTGEIYNTSLSSCNCVSFNRDHKPCKHMYRLAFELGEMIPQFALSYAYAKPEALNLFDTLTKPASDLFMNCCYSPIGQYFKIENSAELQELASIKFLELCSDNDIITDIQLASMKKDDLFNLCAGEKDCPKKSSKKQILIDFIKSHLDTIGSLGEPPYIACISRNIDGLVNSIKAAYYRKYPRQDEWVLNENGDFVYMK